MNLNTLALVCIVCLRSKLPGITQLSLQSSFCVGWREIYKIIDPPLPPLAPQQSPNFQTFKDPRHRFHLIKSIFLGEINSVVELILGGTDSIWRNWRFPNCRRHMLCVGKDTSIGQHISNTQTIRQLTKGGEKSFPVLKISMLWNMADSIPYLVSALF
jgi:hypothetical protein